MRQPASGRKRSVNKERKSYWRIRLLLALLGLAGWIVFATWPRDLGRELRYAAYVGNAGKVERLLRQHPELVNQTFVPSVKNQSLRKHQTRPGSMNIADEFTMYLWDKFVMQAVRKADPDDQFQEIENEMLSALQIAVLKKRLEVTRVLLDHGADIQQPAWQGYQVTIFAANSGPEMMQLILAHGGQVNMTNAYGHTPLHVAVNNPNLDTLRFLLKAGADPNAQNRGGWTPLHNAVMGTRNTNVYALLIQYGARVDITNQGGKTPLEIAREYHQDIAVEFLSREATSKPTIP